MKNIVLSILIIAAAIGIAFLIYSFGGNHISSIDQSLLDAKAASQGLRKFNSSQELAAFLKNIQEPHDARGVLEKTTMDAVAPAAASGSAGDQNAGTTSATDYSQTNVQVAGVDEGDFVKNDGKYIYALSGNALVIVDAYPGENAKIVSQTSLSGNPRDLLIYKDKLIVLSEASEIHYAIPEFDYLPREQYSQKTHVYVYDVSHRENPQLIENYSVDGSYSQSRLIGPYVYLVATDPVYSYGGVVPLPAVAKKSAILLRPEIYYFDNPEYSYVFHTIASFNLENGDVQAKTFMLSFSDTLYFSQNSLYIAYQKSISYSNQEQENKFYEVIVPLLPADVQDSITKVKNSDDTGKWDKISALLENMYNTMGENEKKDLSEKIGKALDAYEARLEIERRKTIIHKINIHDGTISYDSRAEVNGYLLNSFSLDEYNDHLRVATTTYVYAKDSTMYNNVYILDSGMQVVGKIEDIAPDERIYATRFIKDRLYLVTFKNVDPLFVIDLTPENPKVLGELKIPGFSNYLHPYDETHIIGIGKETEGNEWGGVSVKGVKLALFDVSDVTQPKPVGTFTIGGQGTDSEALYEHKAFLFDLKKNILVIPVTEVKERTFDQKLGYYKWRTWQGAYVFSLNSSGFALQGKISHGEDSDYGYYGSPTAVRRSIFMDDYLYTISQKKVKVNNLQHLDSEINTIDLPYTVEPGPRPYFVNGGIADAGKGVAAAAFGAPAIAQ